MVREYVAKALIRHITPPLKKKKNIYRFFWFYNIFEAEVEMLKVERGR